MKIVQLPKLDRALEMMGEDNGASLSTTADIPAKWLATAIAAERELDRMEEGLVWTLVAGEDTEQQKVAKIAPNANAFLCAAFDGELTELLFSPWLNAVDGREAEHAGYALRIYRGSNGDLTKALYAQLETLGAKGTIALNLFRAQKASARAKTYRRRYKGDAYQKKQWSMDNLSTALTERAGELSLTWGWGVDEKQPFHKHVLYVDIPTGQVSFHTEARGTGPDYPGKWDEMPGQGPTRICRWIGTLLAERERESVPA